MSLFRSRQGSAHGASKSTTASPTSRRTRRALGLATAWTMEKLEVRQLLAALVDNDASANHVGEGATAGTTVGVTASAPGAPAPVTYSLADNAGGRYAINGSSGVITVATGALLEGPAAHTIAVQATDGAAATWTGTFTISVSNLNPTATLSAPAVNEGSAGTMSFSGQADPSGADAASGFRYAYDFDNNGAFETGDGTYAGSVTSASATVPVSYFPDGAATHTVRGRIIDKDGGFTDYTSAVTINNVPPSLTLNGNGAANEGSPFTLNLAATDPGMDTVSSWTINWGDGSAPQTVSGGASSVTHVYADGRPREPLASPVINELKTNTPGAHGPYEYVEIRGNPGAPAGDLYFISVEGDSDFDPQEPQGRGTAELVVGLFGRSFGSSGLLTIAPSASGYRYPADTTLVETAKLNTTGTAMENGTNSFLLISSPSPLSEWTDYDVNDDGTLDNLPAGAQIVDAVGWSDGGANDRVYGGVRLTQSGGVIDAATRFFGNTSPNSADAWYNGNLAGTNSDSIVYNDTQTSLNFPTGAGLTPGGPNVPVVVTPQPRLSELDVNPPGADANNEYVELRGAPNQPLYRLFFVSVDGDAGATGVARVAVNLSGRSMGSAGLLVIKGANAGGHTIPAGATVVTTAQMGNGNLQNDSNSFLLIASLNNIPQNADLDTNDDGALDLPPGAVVVDGIGWSDGGAGDFVYGGAVVRQPTGGVPHAATRFANDDSYNTANAWYNGLLSGTTGTGVSYDLNNVSTNFPTGGVLTPGAANVGSSSTAPPAPAATPTYAYTITATATDEDGTHTAVGWTVIVDNVAPALLISGAASVNEGASYTLNLSAVDPGPDTVTSWTIDWGDGTAPQVVSGNPSSVTHRFADGPGEHVVTATATDEDGTYSSNALNVTVNNVAPSVTATSSNVTVSEGQTATNTGTWSDPGVDGVTLSASVGTVVTNPNGTWSWSLSDTDGPGHSGTVTITATDGDGATSTATFALTVMNVAPTLTISGEGSVDEGATYVLDLASGDPGADTITSWTINWGDGTPAQTVPGNPPSVTHVYADGPNSYTITAAATDEDGTYASNAVAVTVRNVAPSVAVANASVSVIEGQTATNTGTWSDPGFDTVALTSSVGTVTRNANGTWSWSLSNADGPNQSGTVTITATDSDGASSTTAFSLAVTNVVPTLAISGAASVGEGSPYVLSLSSSDPGADTITSWTIDWGDGTPLQTVTGNPQSVTHVYADGPNAYAVSATATDEDGTYNSNTLSVGVDNVQPAVSVVNASVTVGEGQTATNSGNLFDPGTDTVTLAASRGTVTPGPGGTWTWSYATADGPDQGGAVTITATDSDGSINTVSFDLFVTNVAPTLTISGPSSVNAGSTYTLNLASSDPGADTISSWSITWGDGSPIQTVSGNPSSVNHTYTSAGAPTISATATDEDGTYASNTLSVTVANVGPTLAISSDPAVNEGSLYTLNLSATGQGADTITSWTITWGDGNVQVVSGNPSSVTHTFADGANTHTVSATATNPSGTYNSNTLSVAVNNVAPTLTISGGGSGNEGSTYTLNLASADPGADVIGSWTVNWGDGSPLQTVTGDPPSVTHVFADGPNSYNVRATATDEDGTYNSNSQSVTVNNVAPTLTISGNASVSEGSPYMLNLSSSDPGTDTITSWTINWGDGTPLQTVTGNPSLATHTYADGPNAYTISATATDGDGTYAANTLAVTVNNVAPTVTISGGASVAEGATYTLNLAAGADPGTDTVTSWTINWGDGSAPQTVPAGTPSVTHVFADGPNAYTVRATATDEDGTYSSNSLSVTVNDVAPTVTISGAASVNEGSSYTLNLASSDPGADPISAWVINWGDGTPAQTVTGNPPSVTHVFADGPGNHTVRATASNGDGTFNSNTLGVTVNNVPPTLTISGNPTTPEGSAYTLNLSSSDPGVDAITSWTINWGDGSAAQTVTGNPSSVQHTYADGPNAYTITASATDGDGTYSANSLSVTVNNVAPTLTISGNATTTEGGNFRLNLAWSDPGVDELTSWTINWGDGSAPQVVAKDRAFVNHTFADGPGSVTITATGTDADGTYNSNSLSVTVNNVAPTVTISGNASVNEGATYTLNLSATDAGADTVSSWTINWGDGSPLQTVTGNPPSVTHVFADGPNTHTVTATATDEDGTYASNSRSVTVNNVAPTLTISGNPTTPEGSAYTLNLSSSDPGVDAITSWTITWGDGSAAQTVTGNPSSVQHTYADGPNAYTITAKATDGDGTYNSNNLSVTVTNVAPTLTISGAASVNEGATYTLNLSSSDPGVDAITSWAINWGDGGAVQNVTGNPASVTHVYADGPNAYIITATATDGDGTYNSNSVSVTVNNVARTLTISGNASVQEGSVYTLSLGTSDPGADTISSWTINWGDGSELETVSGSATSATHVYADGPNAYTVRAAATDEDGTYSSNSLNVSVTDAAPTVTISGAASVNEGSPYTLNLAFSDPGADAVSSWAINWGDGSEIQTVTGNTTSVTHVYADGANSYSISATATNDDGTYNSNSLSVTVADVAPTLTISGATSVSEGSTYTLNVASSDPGTDTITSWTVSWGDGSPAETVTGNPRSATHVYADGPNRHTISATATNEDGTFNAGTLEVSVTDVAPTLTISGAATASEGAVYTLGLTSSGPGADTVTAWTINWGDGSIQTVPGNPASVTHTYADGPNAYTISAIATNEDGTYGSNSLNVTVQNVAPTLTISGDASVSEAGTYTLGLASSDPGADTITSWTINWGDGAAPQVVTGNSQSVTHVYADGPNTYTITATATDEDGTHTANSLNVAVDNVAPTVAISGAASVDEGSAYTLTLSSGDAGDDAVTSWTVNWGDGSAPQVVRAGASSATATHVYDDGPGAHTITATVTDDDGTYNSNSLSVTVNNVAPAIIVAGATVTVNEGQTASNSGTFSDVGDDTVTLTASRGTVTAGPGGTWSWSYATTDGPDQGSTVTITATDSDGSSTSTSFSVVVNNVAPTLTISGAASVVEGSQYTLGLASADPGADTISSWTIKWGDGTIETVTGNSPSATHVYADGPNNYTVSATATDEDGTYSSNTLSVTVQNVAPAVAADRAAVTADEGSTATNTGTWSDRGADVLTLTASAGTVTMNANGTWSWSATAARSQTVTITATDSDGASSQTTFTLTVNNLPPTVTADSASVTVNESQTATNSGTWTNPGGGLPTLTASVGVVLRGEDGTWSWSYATTDGPEQGQTVTITATDGDGLAGTVTFSLAVNNVSPAVTISGDQSVDEGSTYTLNLSASDPGADTVASWSINWGDGSVETVTGNPSSITHVYADGANTYSVTAFATDEDGTYGSNSVTVTVRNVAPSIKNVTNNGPVSEGSPLTVTVSAADAAGGNDPLSYAFDWDNDGAFEGGPSSSNSASHTYADDGTYTVNVRVTDGDGGVTVGSTTIRVNNVAPTLAISGAASVDEGGTYVLSLSSADPGADAVTSWMVNWGDGNSETISGNPSSASHVYADGSNTYTITATATDGDGTYSSNSLSVTVHNVAPTTTITGAATALEGAPYVLTLGAVTDPGADAVTGYVVHWGDGTSDTYTTAGLKTHTYADGPSTHAITVDVIDEDGTHLDRANDLSVTVIDVAPTLAISGDAAVPEGSVYTLGFSASNTGADPITSWTVNWGDGSIETLAGNPSSATHTYADGPNAYTISATATDGDGTYASNTLGVTVNNAAPTLAATSATVTVAEGQTAGNSGTWSEPGVDTVQLTASVGTVVRNANGTWSWSLATSDGPHDAGTVTITATDSDGVSASTSFVLVVNNISPTASILNAAASGVSNEELTFTFGATDASPEDQAATFTYAVNWGDGSPVEVFTGPAPGVTRTHTYTGTGDYTVRVTAADKDGGVSSAAGETTEVTTWLLDNGTLKVGGTAGADTIRVVHGSVIVYVNNEEVASVQTPVDQLTVFGGDGNDVITVDSALTLDTELFGQGGDDTIRGGSGSNLIDGGEGDDDLTGGTGQDVIVGGAGTDTTDGGGGNDVVYSGETSAALPHGTLTNSGPVDEGSSAVVTFTFPQGTSGLRYSYDFDNDGIFEIPDSVQSSANVAAQYLADGPGSRTVHARVTKDGASADYYTTIEIRNVNPTITGVTSNGPVNRGSPVTVTVTASDVGGDSLTYFYDWDNDGTYESGPSGNSASHTFAAAGSYTVRVLVSDGEGGSATGQVVVTVKSSSPTIATADLSSGSIIEGGALTVTGTVTDPAAGTKVMIEWGDGTSGEAQVDPSTGSFSATHYFLDDPTLGDTYTITLRATDSAGGSSPAVTRTVTVQNAVPTVTLTGDATGVRGQSRSFSAVVSDAGSPDAVTEAVITYGDGTSETVPNPGRNFTFGHIYTATGTYTVTMTVKDDDGAASQPVAFTVTIRAVEMQGTDLVVGGTTGADGLQFTASAGMIIVAINGVNQGTFRPTGRIIAFGQAGNDTFTPSMLLPNAVEFHGGSGNDVMVGGAGPNLLLGGSGDDQLNGGVGRNFMIGGDGADRLSGGGADDILIGGRTAHDENIVALRRIMSTWTSTTLTAAQRVNNIRAGIFSDGTSDRRFGLNGDTVFDDLAVDTLEGKAGSDWVFWSGADSRTDTGEAQN